jgi:hypothetical protein
MPVSILMQEQRFDRPCQPRFLALDMENFA